MYPKSKYFEIVSQFVKPFFTTSHHFDKIPIISHGFFGRKGGVSQGVFTSLNAGLQKGDDPEHVCENRHRMALALHMENCPLFFVSQKHTNKVYVLDEGHKDDVPVADAIVTRQKNIIIGVQTADCVPVLFVDAHNGVIGAAHAGWRGLANGILENTFREMIHLGAKLHYLKAAIGPCIWADSYEVGMDVCQNFEQFRECFTSWRSEANEKNIKDQTFSFDLAKVAYLVLKRIGIHEVSQSQADTYKNKEDYFSYRRSMHLGDKLYGSNASLIGLKNE